MKAVLALLFYGHKEPIYAIEKLDHHRFLSGGGDGQLILWNLNEEDKARKLAQTDGSIYAIFQVKENDFVLVCTNKGEVFLVNWMEKVLVAKTHFGRPLYDVSYDSKRKEYWLVGSEGHLYRLDADFNVLHNLICGDKNLRSVVVDQSQDRVLVGGSEGCIYAINISTLEKVRVKKIHERALFDINQIDENTFLSCGQNGQLLRWSSALHSLELDTQIPAHLGAAYSIALTESKKYLATASRDKTVKIWDTKTLLLQKVIDLKKYDWASKYSVNKVCWLSENILVFGGDDMKIRVIKLTP